MIVAGGTYNDPGAPYICLEAVLASQELWRAVNRSAFAH